MRRYLVISALIFALVSVAGVCANYTITVWPYGAIVWVQTPSADAHSITDYATKAVKNVFSFWDEPVPIPAKNWARPEKVSFPTAMARFNALLDAGSRHYAVVTSVNTSVSSLYPPLTWNTNVIYPLFLYFYPTAEAMDYDFADYSFWGSYGRRYSYTPRRIDTTLPSTPTPKEIFIAHNTDWHYIIDHELTHWVTDLICTHAGSKFEALPLVITEGMAGYTAHSLTGDENGWKQIAAVWAQSDGKLDDVPPPLDYDVGTSVVAYLVQQEGKQKFLDSLPKFAADWPKEAVAITPGWRAWLHEVKVADGDRTLYEARLESLSLCAWLLDPVLPQEARTVIDHIYTGHGTMANITQFWKIISVVPPQPSDDVLTRMFHREDTFVIVANRDHTHQALAAQVKNNLGKYWQDWDNYYTWFVIGLRKVIAACGNPT